MPEVADATLAARIRVVWNNHVIDFPKAIPKGVNTNKRVSDSASCPRELAELARLESWLMLAANAPQVPKHCGGGGGCWCGSIVPDGQTGQQGGATDPIGQ